jgi:hypothetical protein
MIERRPDSADKAGVVDIECNLTLAFSPLVSFPLSFVLLSVSLRDSFSPTDGAIGTSPVEVPVPFRKKHYR